MRWASTRVLPEPAPARISSGPCVVVTARACSGLRRLTIDAASFFASPARLARSWSLAPTRAGADSPAVAATMENHSSSSSGSAAGSRRVEGAAPMRPAVSSSPRPALGCWRSIIVRWRRRQFVGREETIEGGGLWVGRQRRTRCAPSLGSGTRPMIGLRREGWGCSGRAPAADPRRLAGGCRAAEGPAGETVASSVTPVPSSSARTAGRWR